MIRRHRRPNSVTTMALSIFGVRGLPEIETGVDLAAMIHAAAAEQGDPLAWPAFATEDDVRGLVRTFVSVNECDPLRDEGVEFYINLALGGQSAAV